MHPGRRLPRGSWGLGRLRRKLSRIRQSSREMIFFGMEDRQHPFRTAQRRLPVLRPPIRAGLSRILWMRWGLPCSAGKGRHRKRPLSRRSLKTLQSPGHRREMLRPALLQELQAFQLEGNSRSERPSVREELEKIRREQAGAGLPAAAREAVHQPQAAMSKEIAGKGR